jgi:hypothetical protein
MFNKYGMSMTKLLSKRFFSSEAAIIGYLVAFKILFHLLHPEYGYFRDEFFYIAISDQFSFANLDMLPLTPLFLKLITAIFGYSIKALHFATGLCGALALLLTCLIARELGGKKYAVLLTGLSVFFSGFLPFGGIYTYDSLDFLLWVSALYLLVRIIKQPAPILWLMLGLVLGLGLLNKQTILFLGLAIFVSLWLVPQRAYFKSAWIWMAGFLALLFTLPFIIWQSRHGWYFIDVAANYSGGLAYVASFPEYVWGQILPNNPFLLPVWLTGLGFLLFSAGWKQFRLFGIMYLFLFFVFFFVGAKFYFLIPMYSVLLAAGSVKIEEFFEKRASQGGRIKFARILAPIALVVLSLPLMPMFIPLLPVQQFIRYSAFLGLSESVRIENHELHALPQHFADRFGWEEMVAQVAQVYDSVRSATNEDPGILTENWGQAGAIHLLGRKYNLPEPACPHGWYYFETLRTHQVRPEYISIGFPADWLKTIFAEVVPCGIYTNPYCMPYENNKPLYLCRKPRFDLKRYWLVERTIDPRFTDILNQRGVRAAVEFYHREFKKSPEIPLFSERQLNALGYEYLFAGKKEDAIALFRLNVEAYPQSGNVYDSLGEGYMENGQDSLAVHYYQKSLEIDPGNTNATQKLRELSAHAGSRP